MVIHGRCGVCFGRQVSFPEPGPLGMEIDDNFRVLKVEKLSLAANQEIKEGMVLKGFQDIRLYVRSNAACALFLRIPLSL